MLLRNSGQAMTLLLSVVAIASLTAAGFALRGQFMARPTQAESQLANWDNLSRVVDQTLEYACTRSVDTMGPFNQKWQLPQVPVQLVQSGAPPIRAGAIQNGLKITQLALVNSADFGIQPSDGNRCIVSDLKLEVDRGPAALGVRMKSRTFPVSFLYRKDGNSEIYQRCYGGNTKCIPPSGIPPRPQPLPTPVFYIQQPDPLYICGKPFELRKFSVLPEPLPKDEGVTLEWIICRDYMVYGAKKLEIFEANVLKQVIEYPKNPLNLPPISVPTYYRVTAESGGTEQTRSITAIPGVACASNGAACSPKQPCCSGFCSEAGLCGDPCTVRGRFKLDQSSCFTEDFTGRDSTCGLPTPADGYLAQGDVRKIEDKLYQVTWFACQGTAP